MNNATVKVGVPSTLNELERFTMLGDAPNRDHDTTDRVLHCLLRDVSRLAWVQGNSGGARFPPFIQGIVDTVIAFSEIVEDDHPPQLQMAVDYAVKGLV